MDYQTIALQVFENKLNYKDNDYIVILNILMESFNKSKGIAYESNMDLKQEETNLVCLGCNVEWEEEDDVGAWSEHLCIDCYTIKYETSDDEDEGIM